MHVATLSSQSFQILKKMWTLFFFLFLSFQFIISLVFVLGHVDFLCIAAQMLLQKFKD